MWTKNTEAGPCGWHIVWLTHWVVASWFHLLEAQTDFSGMSQLLKYKCNNYNKIHILSRCFDLFFSVYCIHSMPQSREYIILMLFSEALKSLQRPIKLFMCCLSAVQHKHVGYTTDLLPICPYKYSCVMKGRRKTKMKRAEDESVSVRRSVQPQTVWNELRPFLPLMEVQLSSRNPGCLSLQGKHWHRTLSYFISAVFKMTIFG